MPALARELPRRGASAACRSLPIATRGGNDSPGRAGVPLSGMECVFSVVHSRHQGRRSVESRRGSPSRRPTMRVRHSPFRRAVVEKSWNSPEVLGWTPPRWRRPRPGSGPGSGKTGPGFRSLITLRPRFLDRRSPRAVAVARPVDYEPSRLRVSRSEVWSRAQVPVSLRRRSSRSVPESSLWEIGGSALNLRYSSMLESST